MRKVSGKEKENTLTAQKEAPQPMKEAVKGHEMKEAHSVKEKHGNEREKQADDSPGLAGKAAAVVGGAALLVGAGITFFGFVTSSAISAVGTLLIMMGAGVVLLSDAVVGALAKRGGKKGDEKAA